MVKDIIIFGAGDFGQQALYYYGKDSVECFADNDKLKQSSEFLEKKIIAPLRIPQLFPLKKVVVASTYFSEIKKQLDMLGVTNVSYFHPRCTPIIDEKLGEVDAGNVVIFLKDEASLLNNATVLLLIADKLKLSSLKLCFINSKSEEFCGDGMLNIIADETYHSEIYEYIRKHSAKNIKTIDLFEFDGFYRHTGKLIINPYENKIQADTEDEWNSQQQKNFDRMKINAFTQQAVNDPPLFRCIEIETINRCNGVCNFCPVNKNVDKREYHVMSEALFNKIIDELAEIDYNGSLSLFSNNEPFLDERIIEFSKIAREKLPSARIHMFTNGTLLTIEKTLTIIDYLDELIIDNYKQDLSLIKPCKDIVEYLDTHSELEDSVTKKLTIMLRKPNEILTTRGGEAPNRKDLVSYEGASCALPFQQLIVRPDGKVSLCCNDPLGKMTLGDATKQNLTEIWYGETYKSIREKIVEGRQNIDHCKYCDTFLIF